MMRLVAPPKIICRSLFLVKAPLIGRSQRDERSEIREPLFPLVQHIAEPVVGHAFARPVGSCGRLAVSKTLHACRKLRFKSEH